MIVEVKEDRKRSSVERRLCGSIDFFLSLFSFFLFFFTSSSLEIIGQHYWYMPTEMSPSLELLETNSSRTFSLFSSQDAAESVLGKVGRSL